VLGAGAAAQAGFSAVTLGIPLLAPSLRNQYDLTLAQIGIVVAAPWVGMLLSTLPWGHAVDRFGERLTLSIGLSACAICLVGAAFAEDFTALVILVGAATCAGSSVHSGSGRAVMRWFRPHERGLALGLRQTAVPIGGAIAAISLPLLGGARAGFLFLASLVLVGGLAGAALMRSRPHLECVDSTARELVLRDRRLVRLCAVSGLYVFAQVVLVGFLVLFLEHERDFSPGAAAAALAASQLGAAAFRIGLGRWSDVAQSRVRPLRTLGCAMAASIGIAAAATTATGWIVAAAFVAATALSMAWNGLSFTIAAEFGGRRSGAAIGFHQTVISASGIVAPIVFTALVSATSWQIAFGAAALFPLTGWILLRSLPDPTGFRPAASRARQVASARPPTPAPTAASRSIPKSGGPLYPTTSVLPHGPRRSGVGRAARPTLSEAAPRYPDRA
jgi:sugar phosphate permease